MCCIQNHSSYTVSLAPLLKHNEQAVSLPEAMELHPSKSSYLIEPSYNTLGVSFYLPPPPSPPLYLAFDALQSFVSHGLDGLHNGG